MSAVREGSVSDFVRRHVRASQGKSDGHRTLMVAQVGPGDTPRPPRTAGGASYIEVRGLNDLDLVPLARIVRRAGPDEVGVVLREGSSVCDEAWAQTLPRLRRTFGDTTPVGVYFDAGQDS